MYDSCILNTIKWYLFYNYTDLHLLNLVVFKCLLWGILPVLDALFFVEYEFSFSALFRPVACNSSGWTSWFVLRFWPAFLTLSTLSSPSKSQDRLAFRDSANVLLVRAELQYSNVSVRRCSRRINSTSLNQSAVWFQARRLMFGPEKPLQANATRLMFGQGIKMLKHFLLYLG